VRGGVPNGSVTVLRPQILRQAQNDIGVVFDVLLIWWESNPRARFFALLKNDSTGLEDDKAGLEDDKAGENSWVMTKPIRHPAPTMSARSSVVEGSG
jgi:hypothetical protein